MKLFVWTENILSDYSSGMAVAVAENVDEARKIILKYAYDEYLAPTKKNDEWWLAYRDRTILELGRQLVAEPDRIVDLPAAALIGGGG